MIKSPDFPHREFASKEELFRQLKENKDAIIALKKAEVKFSKGIATISEKIDANKSINMEEGYVYPVINTTRLMDSHHDVHIDGIWNRSVTDQAGKVYYLADHRMSMSSVIAYPKDVTMSIAALPLKSVGYDMDGNCQGLVFKVPKDKIQLPSAKYVIDEKIDIEHSVRMQYVTLFLCMDSSDAGHKEEKANYDAYIGYVANKEMAEEVGYFWAVTEAKIYKEGSMVLSGSNPYTPLMQKDNEPPTSTQDNSEPPTSTPKKTTHLLI